MTITLQYKLHMTGDILRHNHHYSLLHTLDINGDSRRISQY